MSNLLGISRFTLIKLGSAKKIRSTDAVGKGSDSVRLIMYSSSHPYPLVDALFEPIRHTAYPRLPQRYKRL